MGDRGRVSIFREPGKPLEIKEFEVPSPGEGELVVRVLRANICGSDLHMWSGEAFKGFGMPYPLVLGHEMVGEIVALGKGVKYDSFGQPVGEGDIITLCYWRGCGRCPVCSRGREWACLQALTSVLRPAEQPPYFVGAFSEYFITQRGQKFYKIEDRGIPAEALAGINCALAQVIWGFEEIGMSAGDSVVIQGAGGLGLWATAVAKWQGASKVIVIDAIENRLELAKKFGADLTIKLSEKNDFRVRIAQVKEETKGGADIVVEVAGNPNAIREGVKYLQRGGKYLIMGAINPKQKFEADPSIWIGENLTLKGVSLYHPHTLKKAIDFLSSNKNLPVKEMYGFFRFDDINEGVKTAYERKYPRVQIIIGEP